MACNTNCKTLGCLQYKCSNYRKYPDSLKNNLGLKIVIDLSVYLRIRHVLDVRTDRISDLIRFSSIIVIMFCAVFQQAFWSDKNSKSQKTANKMESIIRYY